MATCKKCGKARVRIVKPTKEYAKLLGKSLHDHKDDMGKGWSQKKNAPSVNSEYQTIGWSNCGCGAGWRSGVMLDPFAGAGTAGLVAKKLGRDYILIDINPEYKKMSDKRLMAIPDSLFKEAK